MAVEDFKGMVLLDGVRWRLNDLERVHPDRVKEAKPIKGGNIADVNVTTTVPGGTVTGQDSLGGNIISTENTAAGNAPVPDTKHEGTTDANNTNTASGGSGSAGTENSNTGTSKRSGSTGRSAKSK